jgi:hypothetical protein
MSAGIEGAILALADAINRLADTQVDQKIASAAHAQISPETVAQCMDAAGVHTTFKRHCSICGEAGRYASTHRDEMRDGTHHWVEVKA